MFVKLPSEDCENMNDISLVVSVMNRTDRVISCLSSWINFPTINDIVLVDWSSTKNILDDKETFGFIEKHPIIRVIRQDGEEYFHLSRSYNLGIDQSVNANILKIDIDHILIDKTFPYFLTSLIPKLNTDFHCCRNTTMVHWGICFFDKNAFYEIGKYNESLSGWGYDDQDFYSRLSKIRKMNIVNNIASLVYHNPHGDDLRVANYKIKDKWESNRLNEMMTNPDFLNNSSVIPSPENPIA